MDATKKHFVRLELEPSAGWQRVDPIMVEDFVALGNELRHLTSVTDILMNGKAASYLTNEHSIDEYQQSGQIVLDQLAVQSTRLTYTTLKGGMSVDLSFVGRFERLREFALEHWTDKYSPKKLFQGIFLALCECPQLGRLSLTFTEIDPPESGPQTSLSSSTIRHVHLEHCHLSVLSSLSWCCPEIEVVTLKEVWDCSTANAPLTMTRPLRRLRLESSVKNVQDALLEMSDIAMQHLYLELDWLVLDIHPMSKTLLPFINELRGLSIRMPSNLAVADEIHGAVREFQNLSPETRTFVYAFPVGPAKAYLERSCEFNDEYRLPGMQTSSAKTHWRDLLYSLVDSAANRLEWLDRIGDTSGMENMRRIFDGFAELESQWTH